MIGHVGPGLERGDVAGVFHSDALTYSGFKLQADLGGLPPGSYQVAAWGVGDDVDGELPAQLAGVFPVQVRAR